MAITPNSESSSNANDRTRWLAIQANFAKATKAFNSAGLAIGTSSKKAVKIANTVYYLTSAGALAKKTTAEQAIAGTVKNATFNCWLISMNDAGTVTATLGTAGATLGAMVIPAIPSGNIALGIVVVNPTGTGDFVGGTTDLDDATVVPNAAYINLYDPAFMQRTVIS